MIYYVLGPPPKPIVISAPGSSDLLCAPQWFLSKSVRPIYYVLPVSRFLANPAPLVNPHSGRWLKIGGDLWAEKTIGGAAKNGDLFPHLRIVRPSGYTMSYSPVLEAADTRRGAGGGGTIGAAKNGDRF